MSEHQVPYTLAEDIGELTISLGRSVTYGEPDAQGLTTLTITPDLTAGQTQALQDRVAQLRAQRSRYGRLSEVRDDIAGLRAYMDIATPTLAQTAAATKAIVRVFRAVLDD